MNTENRMKNEQNDNASPAVVVGSSAPVPLSAKLALLGACFFWAASFIAVKKVLAVVPPVNVVSIRMVISALCFIVWIVCFKRRIKYAGHKWLVWMVLLSLVGTGFHYLIQTIGLKYTTASNASLYAVTGPITITVIAAIFLGEKITLKKGLGILTAVSGVLMVMGLETILKFDLSGHLLGDLLVFTSIFMWGVFTVLGKNMTKRMDALDMIAVVTLFGAAYMLPLGLWEAGETGFSLAHITGEAWAGLAFLGITCSFLATFLYFYALKHMESQKVGVYLYTVPPMTYIIAAVLLGETIGLNLIFGSIVVFAGVYLTEKG